MANPDLVLAGTGGGGTSGSALAWIGATTAAAPTTATAALGTGWTDLGLCSTNGYTYNVSEDVKEIEAYGVDSAVREITTKSVESFDVDFMETSPIVLELYFRKALASLVPDALGAFDFTTGVTSTQYFSLVLDVVDGLNHVRIYAPKVQNATRKGNSVQKGEAITYPTTLTALISASGIATHRFYLLDALKT